MAKPDTPGKRFNEFASQSYWGTESSKKTITAVLYEGPYVDIGKNLNKQVGKFLNNPKSFNVSGKIIQENNQYYILHDRTMVSNIRSGLSAATQGLNKGSTKYQIGQLEFMKDHIDPSIVNRVQAIYSNSSPEKVSEASLGDILQGIFAFQNSYRVNDDVMFGHTLNELRQSDLSGWSFVLSVPVARSRVAGRHDHVELIKAKYLDDGPASTSFVMSGESAEVTDALEIIGLTSDPAEGLMIAIPALTNKMDKVSKVTFRKKVVE